MNRLKKIFVPLESDFSLFRRTPFSLTKQWKALALQYRQTFLPIPIHDSSTASFPGNEPTALPAAPARIASPLTTTLQAHL